jgi:hypothetical protein
MVFQELARPCGSEAKGMPDLHFCKIGFFQAVINSSTDGITVLLRKASNKRSIDADTFRLATSSNFSGLGFTDVHFSVLSLHKSHLEYPGDREPERMLVPLPKYHSIG